MTLPADDGDCLDDEFDAVINEREKDDKKGVKKTVKCGSQSHVILINLENKKFRWLFIAAVSSVDVLLKFNDVAKISRWK